MDRIKKLYKALVLLIGLDWFVISQMEDFSKRLYAVEQQNKLILTYYRGVSKGVGKYERSDP